MDNVYVGIIDDFRSVCIDNVKALRKRQTTYIYKDDVLEKTKELCKRKGIKLYIKKEDDYYIVKNMNTDEENEKVDNKIKWRIE